MAERNYLIEILLKARDDTSRAFAEASANLKGYNALLEQQKKRTAELTEEQKIYAREFSRGTKAETQSENALKALSVTHAETARRILEVENATRAVTRAQQEGKGGTAEYAIALADLVDKQKHLKDILTEADTDKGEAFDKKAADVYIKSVRQRIEAEERYTAASKELTRQRVEAEKQADAERAEALRQQAEAERNLAQLRSALDHTDDDIARRRVARAEYELQEIKQIEEARRAAAQAEADQAEAERRGLAQIRREMDRTEEDIERRRIKNAEYEMEEIRQIEAARKRKADAEQREIKEREEAERRAVKDRQDALDKLARIEADLDRSARQRSRELEQEQKRLERDREEAVRNQLNAAGRQISTIRDYRNMVDSVAKAESNRQRELDKLDKRANITPEQRQVVKERLDIEVAEARAKLDLFRQSERARDVKLHLHVVDDDVAKARTRIDTLRDEGGKGGGGGDSEGEVGGIAGTLTKVQGLLKKASTSTAGFDQGIKNAFGFAAVTLMQPLLTMLVGIIGTMGALYSAVLAAGGALATLFASGIAQGVPAFGLLTAAAHRFQSVLGYVTTVLQQTQQAFIARYQAADAARLGIGQVSIAEHEYSDALYAVGQAHFAVKQSELSLLETRQQATRQLQDLILQEQQAKLAAEASSLSIQDAQKNLAHAIATGGDVAQAQLELQQAQVGHVQATVQAQRSIHDAARGSIARQQIADQVTQAQRAVTQAQRSVVDAEFAARQARAGIILAQRAAAGFNIGVQAQLAWLRSQMSKTELYLANTLIDLFDPSKPTGRRVRNALRGLTDQILGDIAPLAKRLVAIFLRPDVYGALLSLAKAIGGAIREVAGAFTDQNGIRTFVALTRAAAANMHPIAKILADIFRTLGAVVTQAIGPVHGFLGFVMRMADRVEKWATGPGGTKFFKDFFKVGFGSLEAFMNLGLAVIKLIGSIITTGGGAKAGIGVIQGFTRWVNGLTNSIQTHGKVWKDLQAIWATIPPTLHALHAIFGAIGQALLTIGTSPAARRGLQAFADIFTRMIIPAVANFAQIVGSATTKLFEFMDSHPRLEKMVEKLIAISLAVALAHKGFGLLFGGLAGIIGLGLKIPLLLAGLGKFSAFFTTLPALVAASTGALSRFLRIPGLGGRGRAGAAGRDGAAGGFRAAIAKGVRIEYPLEPALSAVRVFVVNMGSGFGGGGGAGGGGKEGKAGEAARLEGEAAKAKQAAAEAERAARGSRLSRVARRVGGGVATVARAVARRSPIVRGLGEVGSGISRALKSATSRVTEFAGALGRNARYARAATAVRVGEAVDRVGGRVARRALSPVARVARSALRIGEQALSKVPMLDLAFLGLGAAQGSEGKGLAQRLASGLEFMDPTALIPGYGGVAHSIFHPLVKMVGQDKFRSDNPEAVAQHLQDKYHIPSSFSYERAIKGESAQKIVAEYDRQQSIIENKFKTFLERTHNRFSDTVRDLPFRFTKPITDAFGTATTKAGDANTKITDSLSGIAGAAKNSVNSLIKSLGTDPNQAIQAFVTNTGNGFSTFIDNLNQAITGTHTGIGKINKQLKHALTATGAKSVQDITGGDISQITSSIKNAVSTITAPLTGGGSGAGLFGGGGKLFSGGGHVGMQGERGDDKVPALLGRGEAVLNWAHQRIVEPAMRAYYKFGLGDMFRRTKARHGAGEGYATGGYVYPFPQGTVVGRTDQGVDANMPVGAPIGPMGPARVVGIQQNWYKGQPFIWWQLLSGALKGAYAFVAEQITNLARPGTVLAANQAVARYAPSGTGIEYGFATASGQTLAKATTGYTEGQVTPAGSKMRGFIAGLARGQILGGLGGIGAGGTPSAVERISRLIVHGQGRFQNLTQRVLDRVRAAANAMLVRNAPTTLAGTSGAGFSAIGANITGTPAMARAWTERAMKIAGVSGSLWENMLLRQESRESSFRTNPPNINDINTQQGNPSRGILQTTGSTFRQYALPGYNSNIIDPVSNIIAAIRYMIARYGQGNSNTAAQVMWNRGGGAYSGGGYVQGAAPKNDVEGAPKNIVAHVGEWVLNKGHQLDIAKRLGTTVGRLKSSLRFTGGPDSFQGGGQVGHHHHTHHTAAHHVTHHAPPPRQYPGGDIGARGDYSFPATPETRPSFYTRTEAATFMRAQRSARSLTVFLANWRLISGDTGLFAEATTAIENFSNHLQAVSQLAQAGFRIIRGRMRRTRILTPVQAALQDVAETQRTVAAYTDEQGAELKILAQINRRIARIPRRHRHGKQYEELIGARNALLLQIDQTDNSIASNYADLYAKQSQAFQTQTTQALRRSTNRLSALQTVQTYLQTFGLYVGSWATRFGERTQKAVANAVGTGGRAGAFNQGAISNLINTVQENLAGVNNQVIQGYQTQVNTLTRAYHTALERSKKDPRWQTVADQLGEQLQGAISSLAQAQAQQLTDTVQAHEAKVGYQGVVLQAMQAAAGVQTALGDQLGGARTGILAAQQSLQNQRDQLYGTGIYKGQGLQDLLGQAEATGNAQQIESLTQSIVTLKSSIDQADVTYRQAINTYQQVATDILTARIGTTGGFFSAASGLAQQVGQMAGTFNLPEQIKIARETLGAQQQQGTDISQRVQDYMQNSPISGGNATQGNSFLQTLMGAFQQGPQSFADTLAKLAPDLGNFESKLPTDQMQTFQALIQAMIDNTTAVTGTTQAIKDMTGAYNRQDFSSSAWNMFREAVFNGLGQLLPKYAMSVPSMDIGGTVAKTGILMAHTGERFTPAHLVRDAKATDKQYGDINLNITEPMEVADPVLFGNALAWRLAHDPNSR